MTRENVFHLDGFPGVSREQAIAFLQLAKEALLAAA